jgi:hypothetical protein
MPLLNTADAIYLGAAAADKVYLGTVQVWPPVVTTSTHDAMVMGFGPVAMTRGTPRDANVFGVMVNVR